MVAEHKPNSFRSPWTETTWGLFLYLLLIGSLFFLYLDVWNGDTFEIFNVFLIIPAFLLVILCLLALLAVITESTINLFSSPNCRDGMTCLVFCYFIFAFLLHIAYSDSFIVPYIRTNSDMILMIFILRSAGLVLKIISMSSIWSNERKQLAYFRFELIVCLVLTMFLGVFNVFFLEQLSVHSLASSIFVAVTPVLALDILPLFVLIDLYALITRKTIIKPTPLE